jgi:plasmid stability protein
MAQVLVRNVDEDVVERLKARAAAAGRSLEAELRDIVTAAAKPSKAELFAELDRIRARSRPSGPGEPTAVEMIREDRDNR